mmetsp:Transcript_7975/g.11383  ORF Transcript_7975/g.11383 Transcript_7975/m.11383 type:complete len:131 (-) Transcript_7975:459-851(-)|eukprot:CAMPEP_0184864618 /NCGR_PEP_ID=MMETSP0580-20130426/15653_1 /TAXON_ID=1118495 /ORGANISM="Dactyliosolen fragilissimus" /LENGTH=130 /DNA_ID=CAMNT_0027363497 /DNA_START=73 /DNA_END=465 /DNA_ORIENTATION=-
MGSEPSKQMPVENNISLQTHRVEEVDSKRVSPSREMKKNKTQPNKNLSGFNLIQYNCRRKKAKYDKCSRKQHSSFLAGRQPDDDEECDDLFEAYKECIFYGMKEDRERRGLPPPAPQSALAGFQEEISDE